MRSINENSTPQEVLNQDGMNYYEEGTGSQYTVSKINKYCNTHGCLVQHYAYRENTGNILPTSLDWEDYLTFFVTNDVINDNGQANFEVLKKCELPVLEYTVPEEVMFKPSSGKSWITIKGSLFYQYNENTVNHISVVNTTQKSYTTAPVEKLDDIQETTLGNYYVAKGENRDWHFLGNIPIDNIISDLGITPPPYGSGIEMWKLKVQLGNKYWNGTNWSSSESYFYLPFNNNPETDEDKEYMPAFKWASIVPNTDYTDKVGEQAYCIPIDAENNSHPSFGDLKITVYTPLLQPKLLLDIANALESRGVVSNYMNWYDVPPVIYCKDFEIGYIYTDSNVWYSQHNSNSTNSDDIIYTNVINDAYVNDFDELQLKINTQQKDKPISRSYVTTSNTYVNNIKHANGLTYKEQEKNLIDMYYEHFNTPKRIYKCNIHGMALPYSVAYVASLGGKYIIDTQSFDVKQNNNAIQLIEY